MALMETLVAALALAALVVVIVVSDCLIGGVIRLYVEKYFNFF